MLGPTTSNFHVPLLSTITMATISIFQLATILCESGGMLGLIVDITSKFNLEKWLQKLIHYKVDIPPSWQAITSILFNLLAWPPIDCASMILGMVLVCNKEMILQFKRN
jgi:hypothetical protein